MKILVQLLNSSAQFILELLIVSSILVTQNFVNKKRVILKYATSHNHPQPAPTSHNHPKPSTTIHNCPKNHPQPSTITQKLLKKAKTCHKQWCYSTDLYWSRCWVLIVIQNNGIYTNVCVCVNILYKSFHWLFFG